MEIADPVLASRESSRILRRLRPGEGDDRSLRTTTHLRSNENTRDIDIRIAISLKRKKDAGRGKLEAEQGEGNTQREGRI